MANNNNFNICSRCGTPNSLVAHYCFQCGAKLNEDEEPVVCSRCGTENSNKALFCKSCGCQLTKNVQTKLCPRCSNTVDINSKICTKCGYSFDSAQQIAPQAVATETVKNGKVKIHRQKIEPVGAKKARVGGLVSMLVAILGLYFLIMPAFARIEALDFGIFAIITNNPVVYVNGYTMILNVFGSLLNGQFDMFAKSLTIDKWVVYAMFLITALTMVVNFLVGFYRICSGKLAKKRNGFELLMFILFILATVFLLLTQSAKGIVGLIVEDNIFKKMFVSWSQINTIYIWVGYYFMVGYFLCIYVLSLIFRRSKKTQVMQIGRV